jgi:hypothetical protein
VVRFNEEKRRNTLRIRKVMEVFKRVFKVKLHGCVCCVEIVVSDGEK